MNDTRTTMTTYVGGDPVEIPATIAGVRAALTEDQRAAFDDEIAHTHALELPHVLIRWALPPEAHDEDEAVFRRLEAGDFTGTTPAEDILP